MGLGPLHAQHETRKGHRSPVMLLLFSCRASVARQLVSPQGERQPETSLDLSKLEVISLAFDRLSTYLAATTKRGVKVWAVQMNSETSSLVWPPRLSSVSENALGSAPDCRLM